MNLDEAIFQPDGDQPKAQAPAQRGVVFQGLVKRAAAGQRHGPPGCHEARDASAHYRDTSVFHLSPNMFYHYGSLSLSGISRYHPTSVIINKEWDMHLADNYDPAEDVLRMEVNPEILNETQERLEYLVDTISDNKGRISFVWDKIKVSIEFENL